MIREKGQRFWYGVRAVTLVPVICAGMLIALWLRQPGIFNGWGHFLFLLVGLVALPLLVYPIKALIRRQNGGSRGSWRIAAIVFAVSGYALTCLVNVWTDAGKMAWMICLEYLVGGGFIFLFNKLMYVNISGHTAGVTGPMLLLTVNGVPWALPVGLGLLLLVGIACYKTEMHTVGQMLAGCGVAVLTFLPLYAML